MTGWGRERLKYLASVRVSNVDKKAVEGELAVRLCNYTDVYYNDSITADLSFMEATATTDQAARFALRRGDTVITKDSETAGDIAVPAFVAHEMPGVVCGYHLAVIRSKPGVDPKYLYWCLASSALRDQFSVDATGVTRFGLRSESIANVQLAVPDLTAQRAVADFLDAETARIDNLIEMRQRMLTLTEERLRAHVDKALSDARLVRLRRIVLDPLSYGANEAAEHEEPTWPRYIRTTDMASDGALRDETFRSLPPEDAREFMLKDQDLLFTRSGATVGKSLLYQAVWGPACHAGYLIKASVNQQLASPRFVHYWTRSTQYWDQVSGVAVQATIQNVNAERFSDFLLPLPSVQRQEQVVRILDQEHALVRSLQAGLSRQLLLLRERRQALITAAVTAEIDVARRAS